MFETRRASTFSRAPTRASRRSGGDGRATPPPRCRGRRGERRGLLGEVAATDEPLVVLLISSAPASRSRRVVGKIERPRRRPISGPRAPTGSSSELGPMRLREAVERQQVLLGALEQLGDLRRRPAETLDHLAAALAGAVVAVGVEDLLSAADTIPRCAGRQWRGMSRTKWTVQRCHGHRAHPGRSRARAEMLIGHRTAAPG